jgi:uncharacterized protein YfkK (UPF0435 family)
MAEESQTITINDTDYNVEDLDAVQQNYLQHVQDLDFRMRQTQFSLQEMQAAREYFSQSLVHSVEAPAEESADE